MPTKAELQAQLDEAGVEYPSNARKAELQALVDSEVPADAVPGRQLRPTGDPQLPAGRHPLPPDAVLGATPAQSRAERAAAQPPLPQVLADRRDARRARYEMVDGRLTLRSDPGSLARGEAGDLDEG